MAFIHGDWWSVIGWVFLFMFPGAPDGHDHKDSTCLQRSECKELKTTTHFALRPGSSPRSPPVPSYCAGPCASGEWQVRCLLWNSLWHLHPQGTPNNQSAGAAPTGKAGALHFLPWMTSDTPSLCLVALKRRRWGFLPGQTAGCNWCGRDVSTNLLLSDGLPVSPSSTGLSAKRRPRQNATWSIRSTPSAPCFV